MCLSRHIALDSFNTRVVDLAKFTLTENHMRRLMFVLLFGTSFIPQVEAQIATGGSASLSGRVVDEHGLAVSSKIKALQVVVKDGWAFLYPKCSVQSNSEGQYKCSALPSGKFLVQASSGSSGSKGHNSNTAASTFYPNFTDLAQAENVSLSPGGVGWADLRVTNSPGVSITGKLVPSAPEAAFTLKAFSDGLFVDTGARLRYDGLTGVFKAHGISPGHYLLEADWIVAGSEHRASVPISVAETSVQNLTVPALANVTISGRIPNMPTNTQITEIRLHRIDRMIPDVTTAVMNGVFQFPVVPAGEYLLQPSQVGNMYVDSLSVDGKRVVGSRFTAGEQTTQTVDVDLIGPALNISGHVDPWISGEAVADVVAVSVESTAIYHSVTDSQHQFTIRGLPPGLYRLYAWPGPDEVPYRSENVLKLYKRDSVEVSVQEGTLTAVITLTPLQVTR